MIGASREALDAARERLNALTDNTSVDAAVLAEELAAVTALLDREVALRRVLTDPAQPGEAKAELVGRLLGGRVGGETTDLVSGMVRSRWSAARDLVDAIEELADTADLIAADRDGTLEAVEGVGHVRGQGLIAAVEVVADKTTRSLFPAEAGVTPRLTEAMLERGVYTRVAMDCICIAPPLVTTDAQLDQIVATVRDAVTHVVGAARSNLTARA